MTDYLHALPPGYRIEEYELVRVLGSGGFGVTYLGYDHHLDKAVAIKEYLPNDLAVRTDNNSVLPKSTQDKADYEWGLARFLNEAQTLARFDHRHIIKIHRFFRAHGTGYSVMEYAEGETLSEVLQRKGTLMEAELKAILFPILDGLEAVHGADFLHRDIKPGNIVIRDDGSPVLIDFGSARQAVAGKSRSVTAIVTPGYAPVEQYSAKGHQGPWTDIYGLGAVCYRCLTGEPPDDATERLRADPLVPAAQRCKGKASTALLGAIDRALRVDEGERPQTVTEWRVALADKVETPAYRQRKDAVKPTAQPSSFSSLISSEPGFLLGILFVGLVSLVSSAVLKHGLDGWWRVGVLLVFVIASWLFISFIHSLAEERSRLLSLFLLSGWLFIMLSWEEDRWLLTTVIAAGMFFICTKLELGFDVNQKRFLLAVGCAVVGVLIIGGMFSIRLWNIIVVGIVALIIIKFCLDLISDA